MTLVNIVAHAQTPAFNRFDENMPILLEKNATSVMIRGLTYDLGKKICMKLGDPIAKDVTTIVTEWRAKNDIFFKGSVAALNEFGDKYKTIGGEKEKQRYLHSVLLQTGKIAKQRALRQLNGAGLDNDILPPVNACLGMMSVLNSGKADIKNKPKLTQALLPYMERKGIQ